MSLKRTMELFDGYLLYEPTNLSDTVAHCIPRNRFLIGNDQAKVEKMFLEEVSQAIKRNDTNKDFLGRQHSVFNAYFYVDRQDGSVLRVDEKLFGSGRFELNFFVRLGREVVDA